MNPHYQAACAAKDLINALDYHDAVLNINTAVITDGDGASTVTLTTPKKGTVIISRYGENGIAVNGRCFKINSATMNAVVDRVIRGPETHSAMLTKTLLDAYTELTGKPRPRIRIKHTRVQKGGYGSIVIKDINAGTAYIFSPYEGAFVDANGTPYSASRISKEKADLISALEIRSGLSDYE